MASATCSAVAGASAARVARASRGRAGVGARADADAFGAHTARRLDARSSRAFRGGAARRAAGRGFGVAGDGDERDAAPLAERPHGDALLEASSATEAREAARSALDALLPDGRDVDFRDPELGGETALIVSAERGDSRAVRLLLAFGADPNLASDSGWTAVHGAAEAGSAECVESLVQAGARMDRIAKSGKTPLDIARQYHGVDAVVTRCLKNLGATYGLAYDDDDEEEEEERMYGDDSKNEISSNDDARLRDASSEENDSSSSSSSSSLELLLKRHRPDPANGFFGATPSVEDVETLYEHELDAFQKTATQFLLDGDSVVVSAPTGSGKTLVGETAVVAALARGQKAIYTTPLKALSNQKLREFQAKFGVRRVGLKTGDVDVNAADADVVVMTTEILRNMLYPGAASLGDGGGKDASSDADYRLDDVGVVILDEVHYLADASRGTVWEETIIYLPKRIQLLCLSATVGNPDDLAGWIEEVHCAETAARCRTVVSDFRPVPLRWHFSMRPGRMWPGLGPLLNRRGDRMHADLRPFTKEGRREGFETSEDERWVNDDDDNFGRRDRGNRARGGSSYNSSFRGRGRGYRRGRDGGPTPSYAPSPRDRLENDRQAKRRLVPHVETVVGQLVAADLLPAVWFIFSRKGCDQAADYLCECGASLVTGKERKKIQEALAAFQLANPDAVRPEAIEPLLLGIASHHAGLLPGWKGLVEALFQRGLLKVVFATETLAAGVNMPARSSVLSALSKRGDSGPRSLTSNEFMQMAGRAGRRGYDTVGHVVCLQSPFEGPEEAFNLVTSPPENLRSRFSVSYGMVLNLVKSGSDLATVRATVERSFGNYLGGRARRDQTRELRRLREQRDALQEQIAAGASEVEPEEWARFTKLDGRLKEERRLLKTVARQTLESRAEGARKAIGEWQTLGEPFVFVEVFVDEFEKEEMSEKASKTRRSPPAPVTVGLAPDGSWIESSVSTNASNDAPEKNALPVNERLNDLFHDDEEEEDDDANEDGESPDLDEPARSAVNERGATKTVAVVDRYDPVTVANGAFASNPFPLGEFLGVDIAGDWVRFTADRVSAVTHRESAGKGAFSEVAADARRDAEETADEKKQLASLVLSAPTETSTKWRRLGDGLWSAAGAETSVFSASRAFETFQRSPSDSAKEREREASLQPLFDGAEELESFLRTQRALVQKTRDEIAEMKSFSDLRRAVKMHRRREEKLKKLNERVEKAEKRVGEYVAAGWSEFTRVVDILIEEGAIFDVLLDEEADTCEKEARERAVKRAEETAKKNAVRSTRAANEKETSDFWDDSYSFGSETEEDSFLDWEPDGATRETFAQASSRFSLENAEEVLSDSDVDSDSASPTPPTPAPFIDEALVSADARRSRRRARWHAGDERLSETLLLTPLGETCAKLRGENELWLGAALSSERVIGLSPERVAGVAGALCCDSNRPTSCVYGPSEELETVLESLEPYGSEIASLQFENNMDAPVNLSKPVAALVEAWAAGSSWDQVRGDTNLDEGDIARVFRRTAELLAQVPRTRTIPAETRRAAAKAATLVLRPPITDLT
jgi:superfamily II RNA helicase